MRKNLMTLCLAAGRGTSTVALHLGGLSGKPRDGPDQFGLRVGKRDTGRFAEIGGALKRRARTSESKLLLCDGVFLEGRSGLLTRPDRLPAGPRGHLDDTTTRSLQKKNAGRHNNRRSLPSEDGVGKGRVHSSFHQRAGNITAVPARACRTTEFRLASL